MSQRVDWNKTDDPQDAVHLAVQALVEEKLVIFPGELGYQAVALASSETAVRQLAQHVSSNQADSEASGSPAFVLDGVDFDAGAVLSESDSAILSRFLSRAWPGPVSVLLPESLLDHQDDLPAQARVLPQTKQLVTHADQSTGVSQVHGCESHPALRYAIRLLPGPIVSTLVGDDADTVYDAWSDSIDRMIDAGPPLQSAQPTVVKLHDGAMQVVSPGVVTDQQIAQWAGQIVVFVCTGNTCRSPLAEGLLKKLLADKVGCAVDELPQNGFTIVSAGLAASGGGAVSQNSLEVAKEQGVDLSKHRARQLSADLVQWADRLIVMTRDHRQGIQYYWPDAQAKVSLLADPNDVSDPYGGPLELYRQTADQMLGPLKSLADQLVSPDHIPTP